MTGSGKHTWTFERARVVGAPPDEESVGPSTAGISRSSDSLPLPPAGRSGRRGGGGGTVIDIPVSAIIRPLGKTRSNGEPMDDGRPPCRPVPPCLARWARSGATMSQWGASALPALSCPVPPAPSSRALPRSVLPTCPAPSSALGHDPACPTLPAVKPDQEKVEALMGSIRDIGLQEPIGE